MGSKLENEISVATYLWQKHPDPDTGGQRQMPGV